MMLWEKEKRKGKLSLQVGKRLPPTCDVWTPQRFDWPPWPLGVYAVTNIDDTSDSVGTLVSGWTDRGQRPGIRRFNWSGVEENAEEAEIKSSWELDKLLNDGKEAESKELTGQQCFCTHLLWSSSPRCLWRGRSVETGDKTQTSSSERVVELSGHVYAS